MKNTLLALMLVSSLFVISCGADATKPGDLQATSYESKTGTATYIATSVTTSTPIDASTIYAGLIPTPTTGDSVKITKILSIKSQDATTGQYTNDVKFTEITNAAGDIVLSVTPQANANSIEISYQYKIDTYPTDSTGNIDVSAIKPTLANEIVYNQVSHATTIKITDPALSLGKKVLYKLYTKNTTTEPTLLTATMTVDGSVDLDSSTIVSLINGDKVYYKIWVY